MRDADDDLSLFRFLLRFSPDRAESLLDIGRSSGAAAGALFAVVCVALATPPALAAAGFLGLSAWAGSLIGGRLAATRLSRHDRITWDHLDLLRQRLVMSGVASAHAAIIARNIVLLRLPVGVLDDPEALMQLVPEEAYDRTLLPPLTTQPNEKKRLPPGASEES